MTTDGYLSVFPFGIPVIRLGNSAQNPRHARPTMTEISRVRSELLGKIPFLVAGFIRSFLENASTLSNSDPKSLFEGRILLSFEKLSQRTVGPDSIFRIAGQKAH